MVLAVNGRKGEIMGFNEWVGGGKGRLSVVWTGVLLALLGGCVGVSERDGPTSQAQLVQEKPESIARQAEGPLAPAEAIFAQAETLGAARDAPKSYAKARRARDDARALMEREPGNTPAVARVVAHFNFEAQHLLHLIREVRELGSLNREALEGAILGAEYRLLAISDALRQPDPRAAGLYDQTTAIEEAAKKLSAKKNPISTVPERRVKKNELDMAHTKIKQLTLEIQALQQQNTSLKRAQRPLNSRIVSLERLVLGLNAEKVELQEKLEKALAPPETGVEITPISRP